MKILCMLLAVDVLLVSGIASAASGTADAKKPVAIQLEGPATFPLKVTLAPAGGGKPGSPAWVDLFLDGAKLKRVSGVAGVQFTVSLAVPAGVHHYEIRSEDPRVASAALEWNEPAPKTAVAAVPTPAATPAAKPAAATPPLERVRRIEAGALVYTRFSALRYSPLAPGIALSAWMPVAPSIEVGASTGWRHMAGARSAGDYSGRVLPEYVVDIDAFPIEAVARYSLPRAAWLLFSQVGAGAELARSDFSRADLVPTGHIENDWAATFSGRVGARRPLGAGMLGISLGARSSRHAFRDHAFDVLHGTETQISWDRSF